MCVYVLRLIIILLVIGYVLMTVRRIRWLRQYKDFDPSDVLM